MAGAYRTTPPVALNSAARGQRGERGVKRNHATACIRGVEGKRVVHGTRQRAFMPARRLARAPQSAPQAAAMRRACSARASATST
jgi:hypothetical protein